MSHVLMENRTAVAIEAALTRATGTAQRATRNARGAHHAGRHRSKRRITLGADNV